jgi:1-aminocyclopropane-1-carboxylate deaminase/D-cysteine desulfhydrase-like pyridoxal-dependent ACC family enzyme
VKAFKESESKKMEEILERVSRVRLALLPTPLEKAEGLTNVLGGPSIFIKRDDCTGLAFGGNKTRKLEFVMADALAKKADVVITIGGLQSNCARQTAAAARKLGMEAILLLNGNEPAQYQGNLLLDRILGCNIRFTPYSDADEQKEVLGEETPITGETAEEVKRNGKIPYVVPLGMSTPLGNLGYIAAIKELKEQSEEIGVSADYIVSAVGSGGTQAGIELGLRLFGMKAKAYGISVSRHAKPKSQEIADLCNRTVKYFRLGKDLKFSPDEIAVNYEVMSRFSCKSSWLGYLRC